MGIISFLQPLNQLLWRRQYEKLYSILHLRFHRHLHHSRCQCWCRSIHRHPKIIGYIDNPNLILVYPPLKCKVYYVLKQLNRDASNNLLFQQFQHHRRRHRSSVKYRSSSRDSVMVVCPNIMWVFRLKNVLYLHNEKSLE